MHKDNTVRLLQEVYKSCKTAVDAIGVLLPKSHSQEFTSSLQRQREKYHSIAEQAAQQLGGLHVLPEDNDTLSKLGMWSSVQINTFTNQNTDHLAEIMINGSTMGIIEMTKYINNDLDEAPRARALAEELLETEQKNIEIMKNYL